MLDTMTYDIRTTENAQKTLINLTGVPFPIWEKYNRLENKYEIMDDLVEEVIHSYGHIPQSYKDFDFIFFHITTSAKECGSYWKYGILDLAESYSCIDSELRMFLDNNSIFIDLANEILEYKGKRYDISHGICPRTDEEAYKCWSIGRKFYYDYTVCGFLSVCERNPYGGQVHLRPEILYDIDKLLGLDLSRKWMMTHEPYEIHVAVKGEDIVYYGDDTESDKEKVLSYLTKAYKTSFYEPNEEVVLLKNHIRVLPENIREIKKMEHWKNFRVPFWAI